MDVDVVRKGNSKREKKWKEAKECLNCEKRHPLSFSLGGKIYALETRYLPPSSDGYAQKLNGGEVNGCWFEVLDTSTDGSSSSWEPLCNPPFPFGACTVVGSWASEASGDQAGCYQIFIEASSRCNTYLFVYDVGSGTWDKFKRYCREALVKYPSVRTGYRPSYSWAVHLAGKDFAPFPPQVLYTGDLRVLTGLKCSIPDLKQAASECKHGVELPIPVKVDTDKKEAVIVPCQNSSRRLSGWDLESLWTLHCLPVESMIFWQAIHLGGPSFCTLAFYGYTNCCSKHRALYVRVSNFDITDAAAAGVSGPIFSAKYGANKVYLAAKSSFISPLPCTKLQPV
ncbi:hypothetical protein RND81_08G164700 [Saponaria officinalis]|uniref:Uncharacterized protein n=1 Tax=Saponaria officinalis TaxID=3572 RepID=A0AAW1J7G9_SAPOF